MGPLEITAMVTALILMFAAMGAKVITTQRFRHMQNLLSNTSQLRARAMADLRLAQAQRKLAEQSQALLIRKRTRLARSIGKLRKELTGMRAEVQHREQQRELARGRLTGPPPDPTATEDGGAAAPGSAD